MGSTAESGRVRLHITPFNAELLDRYIPLSIRPSASDISFHTIQTFPEKGFGYVELPKAEADKLKKKLNGMTLKGSKVKIEEAKPNKKRKSDLEEPEDDRARKERKKAKKEKRKQEQGVLEGHEIDENRYVKRGWEDKGADRKAQKKDKKDKKKSKEAKVENRELRFKTEVPPNAMPLEKDSDKKGKKSKKEKGDKNKTVVKEFENRLKLRPVKDQKPGKPMTYEEGQGWVDEDGQVHEPEPPAAERKRKSKARAEEKAKARAERKKISSKKDSESSDSDSDGSESEFSSEDPSSDEDDLSEEPAANAEPSVGTPDITIEEAKEIHPLEALFKRPATAADSESKLRPEPINTSFSFFASGEADDDTDMNESDAPILPPHTPHTQRDLEWRGLRSGAPTPDTAAIGRHLSSPFGRGINEDDDEYDSHGPEPDTPIAKSGPASAEAIKTSGTGIERDESEFRKWFYENRGDLNRGWKKRRREERKSKRQRDNRVLSRKVV
ncbi:Hypothetical protein R9X50_00208600 [Acrodontium crateriforme]|uniref:Uncharacterized protein n=1 Tax=Acrodontium crateriforme TaxID=150365 RepID=A0AAQ3M0K6_9PEZI|nr:Hypothetical protein R9X50_00208600 [Acrodontium crateriforme]